MIDIQLKNLRVNSFQSLIPIFSDFLYYLSREIQFIIMHIINEYSSYFINIIINTVFRENM